jgi:electron transfer flavoprotein beta subunit
MKILVAVKQAAQLDDDFEIAPDGLDVDEDFIEWDLNDWDRFSVEEALRLRGEGDGEVVLVSVGDGESEEGLRAALAMGADRAIRIWDQELSELDALSCARILASAIEREGPDLVLFGVQSSDGASGSTGAATAGLLNMPRVAVVERISYDPQAQTATVERELEGGEIEELRVRCPALLTIQTGINEPRYATLRAIKQAEQKPVELLGLADLGLDSEAVRGASGARRRRMLMPSEGSAELIDGSAADVAARVAEIVKERLAA